MTNDEAIVRLMAAVKMDPVLKAPITQAMACAIEALRMMGTLTATEWREEIVRLQHVDDVFARWFPSSYAELEGWSVEEEAGE